MPHDKSLWAGLVLVVMACGGGTEPPDPPMADIKAEGGDGSVTVSTNVPVHLSWNSENATSCQVALEGGAAPRAPPTSEHLTGATTYRLSCTGPGGEAEDSVQIVVTPPGTEIVFQADDSSSADIYVIMPTAPD